MQARRSADGLFSLPAPRQAARMCSCMPAGQKCAWATSWRRATAYTCIVSRMYPCIHREEHVANNTHVIFFLSALQEV